MKEFNEEEFIRKLRNRPKYKATKAWFDTFESLFDKAEKKYKKLVKKR